jgi:murein DD-endopeptidase MepM/ murein hydrolase activator NlpD
MARQIPSLPANHRRRIVVRAARLVAALAALTPLLVMPAARRSVLPPEPADVDLSIDAGPSCDASWAPPVTAAVIDGFRPPANPFGPGNRGLEYDTVAGDQVSAVAAGDVVFAGQVGGTRFVVVQHGPTRKVTYGYLVSADVAVGDAVRAGDRIGSADVGFHLTLRVPQDAGAPDGSEIYVDPAPLLIGNCFVVRLVPVPDGFN